MVSRGNDFNDINSWAAKEDVVEKIKIDLMTHCMLKCQMHLDHKRDSAFKTPFHIVKSLIVITC